MQRVSPTDIARCLDGLPGLRGGPRLRAVLADADPELAKARSLPEAVAFQAIRAAGLPAPVVNHEVYDGARLRYVLDLAWPDLLLDYEVDGDAYHSIPPDQAADVERDEWLESRHWTVRRVPARLVLHEPAWLIDMVRADLRVAAVRCWRTHGEAG